MDAEQPQLVEDREGDTPDGFASNAEFRAHRSPGQNFTREDRERLTAEARELRQSDRAHWTHQRLADRYGVTVKTIANWLGVSDPKPGRRKRTTGGSKRQTGESMKARTRELEAALAQVLVFPAVPSTILAPTPEGRAFLAAHFTSAGPRTAHTLAVASEQSHELRELLENLTKGSLRATIAFAVAGYIAPPILWMFGMPGLALGLSQAGGLDPDELAAMFQAQQVTPDAPVESPEPPQPESPEQQGAPVEPAAAG